jgi:alpha-tubulin suppressor-like RCC1 family protein
LSNIDSSCKPTVLLKFSGLVTDLKDVRVTQVSLGKAHAVALTNKGHVYTFGINNKGQCGRDFAAQIKEGAVPLNLIDFVIHISIKTEEEELQILCVQLYSLILHTYFICIFKSICNVTCFFCFYYPAFHIL